jgi:replicative DNA helicase
VQAAVAEVVVAGRVARPASGGKRTYSWTAPAYSRRELTARTFERVAKPRGGQPQLKPATFTTAAIAATLRSDTADRRLNHAVACASPLDLPPAELPVGPYTLGAWLGDGTRAAASITSADEEILERIRAEGYLVKPEAAAYRFRIQLPPEVVTAERNCEMCGAAYQPRQPQIRTCSRRCGAAARRRMAARPLQRCTDCGVGCYGRTRCRGCRASHGSVQGLLRSLGVLGNKHIPTCYLRASPTQRRALLAGLLDTDATVSAGGNIAFAVTNKRLADDVRELVCSLGYRACLSTKRVAGRSEESSTCYTVTFTTEDVVFGMSRKAERQLSSVRAGTKSRYIVDVRPVESVPVRCVQVDNLDHMYLAGRSMIPTHNSTLAMDFARSAAIKHRLPTVIFSLEMSKQDIMMRLFSAESRVKLNDIRAGRMSDEDWRRIALKSSELAEAPLFIDDSPNLTMMEIRAKSRRLKQRHDLKLIVIDYMQLMTSGKRVESRQQEVSEFSRAMKLIAKELEVPVVALSQLNRGPEQRTDKKPMLSDLRESGSIEQDADVVLLVHREDMYERESPRAGEADIIIAKHRNGPTGQAVVAFQGHLSRFVDMPS